MAKHRLILVLLAGIVSALVALTLGSASLSVSDILQCISSECRNATHSAILWDLRLPRVLMGFLAGCSLAMAGSLLQNALRNPLADPYLFGVMAGAGLGATLHSILVSSDSTLSLPLSAFVGAFGAILLVLFVSRLTQRTESLILCGVAIAFMLSAFSQLLLYLAEPFAANRVVFWLMGSLASADSNQVALLAAVVVPILVLMLVLSRQLDALLIGDDSAHSLGVPVKHLRLLMLGCAGALTATVVAYCGGIGFVGLMIPHIARHWFGVTNGPLLLGGALLGGVFLIWVDVIARTALPHQELPIGVITSALGSVFFFSVLLRHRAG